MRSTTRGGLVVAAASLVIGVSAGPAFAAPTPVTDLAAQLGDHGLVLSWTASGTGTPIVRNVTGETAPYDPTGPVVMAAPTSTCPLASCAADAGFANTTSQTYAVWAADSDGSTSDPAVLTVNGPLPVVATQTVLNALPSRVVSPQRLTLAGAVSRAGAPLPGVRVRLLSGLGTAVPGSVLGTATTAVDGRVSFAYTPTRTRSYRLVFDGDAFSGPSSSVSRVVGLVPRLTAGWYPSTVVWRTAASLRGTVQPVLPGVSVAVQRWTTTGWVTVGRATVGSTSTWAFSTAPAVGRHSYRAVLPGGANWVTAVSPTAVLAVVPRTLVQGMSGPDVLAVERRLAALHYDVGRIDGYDDYDLRHAITAFEKVEGLPRHGTWGAAERLRAPHPHGFTLRYHDGRLTAEVDVTRQVLVLARNGVVQTIVDVSTGSERVYYQLGVRQVAHTPRGVFSIYYKIDGIRVSPLGELYKPSYFFKGFAIHGNSSVPTYPASHGCVRITNHVANRLFPRLLIGTRVAVYDE